MHANIHTHNAPICTSPWFVDWSMLKASEEYKKWFKQAL